MGRDLMALCMRTSGVGKSAGPEGMISIDLVVGSGLRYWMFGFVGRVVDGFSMLVHGI